MSDSSGGLREREVTISAALPYKKRRLRVLDREMAFLDEGGGDPIVLLHGKEMGRYRLPFARPGEDRRPTLSWPRQIPVDGEPADVTEIVDGYSRWLSHSDLPKLFVNGEPGTALTGSLRRFCRTWPAQREVTVRGVHFLQEDSPEEIGGAIATWLGELRAPRGQGAQPIREKGADGDDEHAS